MKNILIVDDDIQIADTITRFLHAHTHSDITYAHSGVEALEILHKESINLVLLDYNMPFMNGDQLLNIVHHDTKLKKLPIIVVSSHLPSELETKFTDPSIKGILCKANLFDKKGKLNFLHLVHETLTN